MVKKDLEELMITTYTNKMHHLFRLLNYKNFKIKCDWLGTILGRMTTQRIFL